MEITATIDGKVKIVYEPSIRRHLKLEDYDCISNLATTKFFEQLALMGASKGYTGVDIPLFPTMFVQGLVVQGEGSTVSVKSRYTPTSAPSTLQPPSSSPSRRTTIQESVVPQPRSPTQTNVADEAASTGVDVRHGGTATTVTSLDAGQGNGNIDKTPSMPHDSPLPRVHTLGSDKGRIQHNELMDLVTKMSDRVVALETELQQDIRKARIVISDNEEDLKGPSKQGRKIAKIDQDPDISLVQHDAEVQGRHDFEFTAAKEVYTAKKGVSTVEPVSTAGASVSTTGASSAKDKGKAIMEEAETIQTKTKLQLDQERLGYEEALRLQAEIDEEERVEADEDFAQRLQSKEREMYSKAEKTRLLAKLTNERKRYFAAQRAKERRNKPLTQAQQRTYMSQCIKNIGSHTLKQLKSYSFDEIKNLFETTIRSVHTFVPMESESERVIPKLAVGSSKRDAEEELVQESPKRLKTRESLVPAEEPKNKEELRFTLKELGSTRRSSELSLVKEKFTSTEPTEDKEREHIHDITWRLYDTCGVHHISTKDGVDIYMLVEREYPLSRGVLTQMLVAKLLVEQDNEMSRELLRKIFMQVERPRR
ncbi:hypothetical protein Tco_0264915 [Tanacetum coccineum]